jgi:hypothetical protein
MLKTINKITTRTPMSPIKNKKLAIFSSHCSLFIAWVRMDKNEKKQEKTNSMATTEVNSSIMLDTARSIT